jgi:F-type H+-transporting ATPase subunit gamma
VSRRREVERHRQNLGEIRDIVNAMKGLAYLETRKLDRFLSAQQAVVRDIEEAAADFLGFYAQTLPETGGMTPVCLLLGSERGFCADFNQSLLRRLEGGARTPGPEPALLLPVGRKLHPLLQGDPRVLECLAGASVVEEVPDTLSGVIRALTAAQGQRGPLGLYALYHEAAGGILARRLLPPRWRLSAHGRHLSHPPELNLPPHRFLLELTDHYLFAALHEMLYTSLMAENQLRVSHLEGAVRRLDEQSAQLARRSNRLRQEEIIEEIEVILLSATGTDAR